MVTKVLKIIILGILMCFSINASAKVWINEFMQSNVGCLMDDRIEFPDSWVELYNDSDSPVSIRNWYISVQPELANAWRITTNTTIPAKGYQLVYCDKAATGLHTSFRIDSGKGDIYLFDSDGAVVDQVTNIPKQPAPNITRARTEDGGNIWSYLVKATPAAKNEGEFSGQMLLPPRFSIKGGIYKNSVTVALSLPAGAPPDVLLSHIRYTTDGSEPTAASASYNGEITIEQSTPLRAAIIAPGYLINRSATQSYIITDRDFTLPVISISLNPEYLWDDKTGIYVEGDGTNGVSRYCSDRVSKYNFHNDWRRPMNIEYFPSQTSMSVINQLGELRIAGGCTRTRPQKSLILYANKRFGENRYNYPLFKDKPDIEIKSFMLRNSGNDFLWANFRDAAIQLFMAKKVDVDYQAFQPAVVFINGEYWGIQNLRERSNEDFIFSNYGFEDNQIDMIENWTELKAGDKVDFNNMISLLEKPFDEMPIDEIMEMIDVEEFINYMILQVYVANADFPWNNHVMWKPKTEGGKWRFILKDLDHSIGFYNGRKPDFNSLNTNTLYVDQGNYRTKYLFHFLLLQESFKKDFYTRFAIYMGDILHAKENIHIIDSIKEVMQDEIPYHFDKWWSKVAVWDKGAGWEKEVTKMKNWCAERQPHMYKHLNDFFELDGVVPLTITVEGEERHPSIVSFNDIDLQTGGFDGMYYKNEEVKLSFKPASTYFTAWRISYFSNSFSDPVVMTYGRKELRFSIASEVDSVAIELLSTIDASSVDMGSVFVLPQKGGIEISSLPDEKNTISVFNASGQLIAYLSTENETIFIPLQKEGLYIVQISNRNTTISRKTVL